MKDRTSKRSRVLETNEPTGIDRLYKRTGVRKVSFWYKYPDGRSETFETAQRGDRAAILEAERRAKRRAVDVQAGHIISGSVADAIDRFKTEVDPKHFRDQSRDGKYVRDSYYEKLTRFFGRMAPTKLETHHGYQYLDARAAAGAPIGANKEMALMQTMCNYWIRWGIIKTNPFVGMMLNQADRDVRTVERQQIVRFYLWSVRQEQAYRTMGTAAMFCYLTGFRAAEVRPFHLSGITDAGVRVVGAKRKRGEAATMKLREWSQRLHVVVERAKRGRKVDSLFLFPNRRGQPYSKSGWASVWQDAMYAYIGRFDSRIARECEAKRAREAAQRKGFAVEGELKLTLVDHPAYFSMLDVRPAAITTKLANRDADAYDFAAHANPSTTHKHYDRRKVKVAKATE
ncbi:site-specific integrase [Burkholderia sp. YIM B11467]